MMSFRRLAALAGLVFVVLIVANIIMLGTQPSPEDSVDEVISYLDDDHDLHKVASYVGHLVLIPGAIFFAGLVSLVRISDREHGESWGTAALIGALGLAMSGGMGDVALGGLDAAAVRGLWDLQWVAYTSGGAAVFVLVGAVAVPGVLHRLYPTWYGVLSILVALAGLVGLAATVVRNNGDVLSVIGLLPFLIWVLVTSWLMMREPAPAV
jgi:hypothetical protein